MIPDNIIAPIGQFGHPHGISGEIAATVDIDADPSGLSCIVVKIDGINVPMFVDACRPKSAHTLLLTIDGIDSDIKAAELTGKEIYALRDQLPQADCDDCDDGLYASDLVGYTVTDTDHLLHGTITDINDDTANVLFVVSDPERGEVLIPVADELIDRIDTDARTIVVALPEGFLDV